MVKPPNLEALFADLVLSQKETDRRMQETDRRMQETSRVLRETDHRINRLFALSGYDIGRMVEAIVEPSCVKLFRDRGVDVRYTMRRVEADVPGEEMEIDILMLNGTELVAVEVKARMKVDDVRDFAGKLKRFKRSFPQYRNHRVLGAVAAMEYSAQSNRLAYKQGLFVLHWADDLMRIANSSGFKAKAF